MWAWIKRLFSRASEPPIEISQPEFPDYPVTHLEFLREGLIEDLQDCLQAESVLRNRIAEITAELEKYEE